MTKLSKEEIDVLASKHFQAKALMAEVEETKKSLKEAFPEGGKLIGNQFIVLIDTFDPKEVPDDKAIFEILKDKYADEYEQLAIEHRKIAQTPTRITFK